MNWKTLGLTGVVVAALGAIDCDKVETLTEGKCEIGGLTAKIKYHRVIGEDYRCVEFYNNKKLVAEICQSRFGNRLFLNCDDNKLFWNYNDDNLLNYDDSSQSER